MKTKDEVVGQAGEGICKAKKTKGRQKESG